MYHYSLYVVFIVADTPKIAFTKYKPDKGPKHSSLLSKIPDFAKIDKGPMKNIFGKKSKSIDHSPHEVRTRHKVDYRLTIRDTQ